MRIFVGLGFATLVAASAFAARFGSTLLDDFTSALQGAKSLKATYLVQEIGGARDEYEISLKKPNLVRLDGPTQLVVADGKEIVILDKAKNSYYRQPETAAVLKDVFAPNALHPWYGFFDSSAYENTGARDLGSVSKGDHTYSAVETQLDKAGNKLATYYLDPSDKVARQVEFDTKHDNSKTTLLLRTRNVEVNGGGDKDDLYTFSAPNGAQEVSLADMLAGKWYTSLSEAEKAASASGGKVFIDFMATWCGPCKMLDREVLQSDKFKTLAAKNHLVLCRIDVDLNQQLAQQYGATAIPQQDVVDVNGKVIAQTVGYGGADAFYSFLQGALNSNGSNGTP